MSKKRKKNIRIGIWGGVGAGKATYLTMLYRYFTRSRDWKIEVHPGFSEVVVNYSQGIDEGKFPDKRFSLPEKYRSVQSLNYTLTPTKNFDIDTVTLSFLAAPGEFYENCCFETVPIIENQDKYENAIDYYLHCDGIILLLDYKKAMSNNSQSYHRILDNFFTSCQRHWTEHKTQESSQESSNVLPHYFAFCLSKADRDTTQWNNEKETDMQREIDNLFSLGKQVIGQNVLSILQGSSYFDFKQQHNPAKNRCKFYYLSSIGRDFKEGKYQESVTDLGNNFQNDNLEQSKSDTSVQRQNNSQSRPSEDIFRSSQPNGYSYSPKQPNGEIKLPAHSLEPLNIFSPLQWMINNIPDYPPF